MILNTYTEDIWLRNGLQAQTGRSNVCNARNISRMPRCHDRSMSSVGSFLLHCISLTCVTNLWWDAVLWMPLLRYRFTWRTLRTLSLSSPMLAVPVLPCLCPVAMMGLVVMLLLVHLGAFYKDWGMKHYCVERKWCSSRCSCGETEERKAKESCGRCKS